MGIFAARCRRAMMAGFCAAKGLSLRAGILARAPGLILSPNTSSNRALSRANDSAWKVFR